MSETKTFHIGDILSITTGRLVSPRHIDGVYDILDWMTNDQLFTHQLPRASREAEPHLKEWFPDLAAIEVPDDFGGEEAVWTWLDEQVAIYGKERAVPQLEAVEHTHIDPLTELSTMMRPDQNLIVVEMDGQDD